MAHPNFVAQFPKSAGPAGKGGLALSPVSVRPGSAPPTQPAVELPGFDNDQVLAALGQARYNNLVTAIKTAGYSGAVFSCGHRTVNGVEVHCFYASDVEKFLAAGG